MQTSIQHPASSIQHPASSIQHPASSIQHPANKTLSFNMSKDNIGNFFDPEDFEKGDDDEMGEAWKPENVYGKELFRKSIEILNLTDTICAMLPEEDEQTEFTR